MDSLRLPLAKFSRAVDVTADVQHFTWRHVSGQDLVLTSDTFRGPGDLVASPMRLLKVLQGTEVWELLPLEELLAQAREVLVTMRNLHVEIKNEQLPISALYKSPLLAIRYNLPEKKLRRIQLKFTSDQDFNIAYDHLNRLGLRMTQIDQNRNPPKPLPAASSRESAGAISPVSRTSDISARPYSALPGPLPQAKPSSAPRVSSPLAQGSFTNALDMQQKESNLQRPASAYSALVNRDRNPAASLTASIPSPLIPPEYFPRPGSAISNTSVRSIEPPSTAMERSAHMDLPTIDEATSSPKYRPGSAQFYPTPRTDNDVLPPRRELPFARSSLPKSAGSDSARPTSRASTGSMPPPTGSRASRTPSRGVLSRPVSGHYNEPPPLPQPTFLHDIGVSASPASESSRLPRQGHNVKSLPIGPRDPPGEGMTRPGSHSTSNDAAYSSGYTDPRPLSAPSTSSLNMQQATSSPVSSPGRKPPTPASSEASYQNRVVSELRNHMSSSDQENLAAYATHSSQDRMAILNDFMMSHLDDDNFCTLVQDVSVCWARIGLGLE